MALTHRERVLRIGRRKSVFSAADVRKSHVHTSTLTRLVRSGAVERAGRGKYRLSDGEITRYHSLVLASAAVPDGVMCLLSALAFHEIGTQLPREVWIARGRGTWRPRLDYPPIRIVLFSGAALTAGVEVHTVEGHRLRVYNTAKTIADCFKFRNRIGLDVVLEALTDAWRSRRVTMHELERYARICRVSNVMRPYLEALTA